MTRLDDIRRDCETGEWRARSALSAQQDIRWLLAEVDRLRAALQHIIDTIGDPVHGSIIRAVLESGERS